MSTTADSYRENFNNLKERVSVVNKRLKTENEEFKRLTQRMIVNTGAESVQDLDTNFGRTSGIMEDQNKVIGDTHELTEKVLDSLKSKEIYCLRDCIRIFLTQVQGRYDVRGNVRGWARLLGAFDIKTTSEKVNPLHHRRNLSKQGQRFRWIEGFNLFPKFLKIARINH